MKIDRDKLRKQMQTISFQKKQYIDELLKLVEFRSSYYYYCLSKGNFSIKYLRKLALIWVDIDSITKID